MSLLGQRLRQEREARGLALLQVEIDTRIRANLIQALEDGRLEGLPPEPFLRGLIRCYAEYLHVDPQEMLDLHAADITPATPANTPRPPLVNRPAPSPYKRPSRPPMENPAQEPSAETSQPTRAPVEEKLESSQAPASPVPVAPGPAPEPLKALRRRLPLAPPSPKPPNPAIKAYQAPPPSIPPEFLPPPDLLKSPAPQTEPTSEQEAAVPAKETQTISIPPKEKSPAADGALTIPDEPKSVDSSTTASASAPSETEPKQTSEGPKLGIPSQLLDHLAHISTQTKIVAAILLLGLLAAVALLAYPQIEPAYLAVSSLIQTPTPTRLSGTATATFLPGSQSTIIPTLAATAPPFAAVPSVPTREPTVKVTATVRSSSSPAMNLEIAATAPVTAQVGIDGVLVHSGPLAAGTTLTWSAFDSLYLRVENLPGATVTFNDRRQVALSFAERAVFVRQWKASADGKVASVNPVAPRAASPTRAVPALVLTNTPTPTLTIPPSATPSITPSATRTLVPSATPSSTRTVAPSVTPSPTKTAAPSVTPSSTPTITPTSEPASPTPKPTLTPFGGQF